MKTWTPDDVRKLYELRGQGFTAPLIGERLGRSSKAIHAKFRELRMDSAKRDLWRARQKIRRAEYLREIAADDRPRKPDPAAIEEMHYRNGLEPRDVTARFCGDPLPGYSALDRS